MEVYEHLNYRSRSKVPLRRMGVHWLSGRVTLVDASKPKLSPGKPLLPVTVKFVPVRVTLANFRLGWRCYHHEVYLVAD